MLTAKSIDSALQVLRKGVFRKCEYLTVSNNTWQLSQKSLKQEDSYHISVTERAMREKVHYVRHISWRLPTSRSPGDARVCDWGDGLSAASLLLPFSARRLMPSSILGSITKVTGSRSR